MSPSATIPKPLSRTCCRDTVSSTGSFRGEQPLLSDFVDNLCFFRHALALDERRVKFLPEFATRRDNLSPTYKESEEILSIDEGGKTGGRSLSTAVEITRMKPQPEHQNFSSRHVLKGQNTTLPGVSWVASGVQGQSESSKNLKVRPATTGHKAIKRVKEVWFAGNHSDM